MGKHTKRSTPIPRRSPEEEPQEDRIEFDFLTETDGEILDFDADSIIAEFLPEQEEPYTQSGPEALPEAKLEPQPAPEPEPEPEPKPESEPETEPRRETSSGAEAPAERTAKPRTKKPSGKKRPMSAAARARRELARSRRRFRRGLLAYVLILLALIIGTLVYEWNALDKAQAAYEAEAAEEAARKAALAEQQAHEKAVYRAPQLAFESWLGGVSADYWADLWLSGDMTGLDPREGVVDYMSKRFGAAQAFRAMEYTRETPVYVLKDGDDALAMITLTGSELDWTVSNVELLIQGTKSASVRVASGSTVTCNGIPLGKEYIVNSDSYFRYEPLRDKLVNPVSWDTYEVSGLLLDPALSAEPPTGGSITQTAEGDYLICLDGDTSTYTKKSVAFVKDYLFYYMSGGNNTMGNLSKALSHLTPGTQAYKELNDTYNGVYWNTTYSNIDTSDTKAGDVVIWADNVYSVDVAYNAKGFNPFSAKMEDYASAVIRLYFMNSGNGFYISNFETL